MKIANPIYDVVFKYLMEDSKSAKIILSALTGLDIVELELFPQEFIGAVNSDIPEEENLINKFKVYRLDFKAKVKSKEGEIRLVILEIQKSKVFTTPMRFRTYLGYQLNNKDYYQEIESDGKKYKAGLPIISIYFLGELINKKFAGIPVIKVKKEILDAHNGNRLQIEDHFINSLFHEGIIVNIPALRTKRRDEIEILLSIFDQDNKDSQHIMNINEVEFPDKYRPIVRRLHKAVEGKELEEYMRMEDDFQAELDDLYMSFKKAKQESEQARKESEQARKESEQARKESEQARKESEQVRKETEQVRKDIEQTEKYAEVTKKELAKAIRAKEEAVVLLVNSGVDKSIVASKLNITQEDIDKILKMRGEH